MLPATAWRHLARVSQGWNAYARPILGSWPAARDRGARSGSTSRSPLPTITSRPEQAPRLISPKLKPPARTRCPCPVARIARAAAVVQSVKTKHGQLNLPEGPVFNTLLRFGVSEHCSLHAEKYFHTVQDDSQHSSGRSVASSHRSGKSHGERVWLPRTRSGRRRDVCWVFESNRRRHCVFLSDAQSLAFRYDGSHVTQVFDSLFPIDVFRRPRGRLADVAA